MSHHANRDVCSRKGINYTMIQGFEWYNEGGGVHWKKLTSLIPSLADTGITAIWIPPPTKASGNANESVGYDIYDLYDLGEFDQKGRVRTKYGTKEELLELARTAKEHDIVIYVDTVLNHKFGADDRERFKVREVDSNDRSKPISDLHDIEGWTKFTFDKRNNQHSDFKWNFNHFTAVDFDAATDKKAIFKIEGIGKDWATHVDHEHGNYDFLMGADIDHRHPDVVSDLFRWGNWVHSTIGDNAAGFRFDAIKHIERDFIANFIKHVRQKSGPSSLFAVGEFWKDSADDISQYLDRLGAQFSVFDVPLHYNFKEAADRGRNFDIRSIWDGSVVRARPIDAVTFVDNHDTQIGQSLESWVAPYFKPLAYAMILLRPQGYPCVFWGDLYGCGGNNPQQPVSSLSSIIKARYLFSYGETRDYWDYPTCVGWVRVGDDAHDGCAVVISSGDEGWKWMEVGRKYAGEDWTDFLGWYQGAVKINEDGWGKFSCHAQSISIWVNVNARGRTSSELYGPPI